MIWCDCAFDWLCSLGSVSTQHVTHYSRQCHCSRQSLLYTFAGHKTPAELSHTPAHTISRCGEREASSDVHFTYRLGVLVDRIVAKWHRIRSEQNRSAQLHITPLRCDVVSVLRPSNDLAQGQSTRQGVLHAVQALPYNRYKTTMALGTRCLAFCKPLASCGISSHARTQTRTYIHHVFVHDFKVDLIRICQCAL